MKILGVVWRVIACCFLVLSCVNRENTEQTEVVDAVDSAAINDSAEVVMPIWQYDYAIDSVVRIGDVDGKALSVDQLVDIINDKYQDKVEIRLIQQQADTVYVKIDSAVYLTQQMGSAGARDFMSVATFTLTEAEGVAYVSFDFVEGDHAGPGVYDRTFFLRK